MEIDNNRIASLAGQVAGRSAAVEIDRNSPDVNASAASGGADLLSLTGRARQLQQLERQLAGQPAVDTQRVMEVRAAVENGTFAVNPRRIAEKLISLEQALTETR